MLDIQWIKNNQEEFNNFLIKRGIKDINIEIIIKLYDSKKKIENEIQILQRERNKNSTTLTTTSNIKIRQKQINKKISHLKTELKVVKKKLDDTLNNIPNIPKAEVPHGINQENNLLVRKSLCHIKKNKSTFHIDIAQTLGMIENEKTTFMSGSRFVTLKNQLAKLKRALINFMLDTHIKEFGFEEIDPPYLVKDHAMYNAGQLPKFDKDSFYTTRKDRLIPTAEVPLINLFANTTTEKKDLPIRLVSSTMCFRSEAGSARKDTKGMIRLHQFSKVELVSICTPQESEKELQYILNAAEIILEKLQLPYKTMLLCSQDMPFSSEKTYDIEVWMPGQDKYKEISSCSSCSDFQARRLNAKYNDIKQKKNTYVNTINGSALAIERTIASILENYFSENTLYIPKVLQKYMEVEKISIEN